MRNQPVANRASLSGIRKKIRAELAGAGADPAFSFDCLVAVTEACTNALIHGYEVADGDAPSPEIRWEIEGGAARFYVRDYSRREWTSRVAHPSRDADPLSPEEVDRRARGLGLEIMRSLMDEVAVDVGSNGTTVSLYKRL